MNEPFDFIAIGDTVTDDFIRIKEASVLRIEGSDGVTNEELCLVNGAKIPYEFNKILAGVGNSANAAVAAARLGLRSALVADVGADRRGNEILSALAKEGVDTRFIRSHEGLATNFHYVLWHNAERTILIKHENYPYALPDIGEPRWIYFSSVGENSLTYHDEIAAYLEAHPAVKLAFQPGTFQIKLGAKRLARLYERAEIFFCNVEEARVILNDGASKPEELPKKMSALGPKISVITDGPKGAYAYVASEDRSVSGVTYFMPPYPDPKPPYERTGAGDACASTITIALALGLPFTTALQWGPINSMSVVQYIGAQEGLLTRAKLEEYLRAKPEYYVAEQLPV